jgi:hypothetical protein
MAKAKESVVYKLVAPAKGATFLSRQGNAKYTLGKTTKSDDGSQSLFAYATLDAALRAHADDIGMGFWTVLACEVAGDAVETHRRVMASTLKPLRVLGTFNSLPGNKSAFDTLVLRVRGRAGADAERAFMQATKVTRLPKAAPAKKAVKKAAKKAATGRMTRR